MQLSWVISPRKLQSEFYVVVVVVFVVVVVVFVISG